MLAFGVGSAVLLQQSRSVVCKLVVSNDVPVGAGKVAG